MSHTTHDYEDACLHALIHNGDWSGEVDIVFKRDPENPNTGDDNLAVGTVDGRELLNGWVSWQKGAEIPVRVMLRATVIAVRSTMRDRLISLVEQL